MPAAHSTGTLEEARDLVALETGLATPKVDVRALVGGGMLYYLRRKKML